MTIRTKSGSFYLITMKDGQMYLMKGMKEYLINKISYGIGLPLEITCQELDSFTCKVHTDTVTIRSTPIVEIRF